MIKRFAKAKGVEFMMMDKVDVNGLDAHPVYHYLKKVAGPVRDRERECVAKFRMMFTFQTKSIWKR